MCINISFFLFIYKKNTSNDVHICVWTYDVDLHFQHRLILPLPPASPPLPSPRSFSERLPLVYHRREVKLFALSRRYTCGGRERKTSNAPEKRGREEMRKKSKKRVEIKSEEGAFLADPWPQVVCKLKNCRKYPFAKVSVATERANRGGNLYSRVSQVWERKLTLVNMMCLC